MLVTLARSMDAVAICTCSLPTAGLPRHLPLTLSLLPRTTSPTTGGRRRPGPRQPRPGAPAPRPPAEVQPVRSVGSRGGGGGVPQRPAGTSEGGGQSLNPAAGEPVEGDVPPPESGALPVRVGVRSGARRRQLLQKLLASPGCLLWAGRTVRQRCLAGEPAVRGLRVYSSQEIRNKNK